MWKRDIRGSNLIWPLGRGKGRKRGTEKSKNKPARPAGASKQGCILDRVLWETLDVISYKQDFLWLLLDRTWKKVWISLPLFLFSWSDTWVYTLCLKVYYMKRAFPKSLLLWGGALDHENVGHNLPIMRKSLSQLGLDSTGHVSLVTYQKICTWVNSMDQNLHKTSLFLLYFVSETYSKGYVLKA